MIRLHLLGFTPDLKGLVFSGRRGGRTGTYWVPVDEALELSLDQLVAARAESEEEAQGARQKPRKARKSTPILDDDLGELTLDEIGERLGRRTSKSQSVEAAPREVPAPPVIPKVESRLSPREMQQMLREGKTISDVASQAGVEQAWVERFVGPVLLEMGGIIDMTRRGFLKRPRLGQAGLPIGEAIVRNLQQRKATPDTMASLEDGWEARRARSGAWRVRLKFKHRGKRRTAEWEFLKEKREVTARNALAKDLGWWNPTTPRTAKAEPKSKTSASKAKPKAKPKAASAKSSKPRSSTRGGSNTRRKS